MPPMPPPPPVAAAPSAAATRPGIPIWGTVRDAFHLVARNPRETMLPLLVIQLPLALLVTGLTTLLYFTAFESEPFYTTDKLFTEGSAGAVFAWIALTAVDLLFGQVARGASVVSIAALIGGKRLSLSEALDPAFTRMGGLLALTILLIAGGLVLGLSIIGFVVLPILALRLGLTIEAYMLDGGGPLTAIRNSWRAMGGPATRRPTANPLAGIMTLTMLRLLAVGIVLFAVVLVPLLAISASGGLVGGSRGTQIITSGVLTIGQSLVLVPVWALISATLTSFYLQARARANA